MGEDLEDVPLPQLFNQAQQIQSLANSSRVGNVGNFMLPPWRASSVFHAIYDGSLCTSKMFVITFIEMASSEF